MYKIKFSKIVKYKFIYSLVLISILFSCNDFSEDNRKKFRAVIDYYQAPEDSLKLKAAYFLIDNMSNHYYQEIRPRRKWEKILLLSDSLIKIGEKNYDKKMREEFYSQGKFTYDKRLDAQTITSSDLIDNIDMAFKVWSKPWNKFLGFNDFCNFILPYRSKNEPIDIGLRKKVYTKYFNKLYDSIPFSDMLDIAKGFSTYSKNKLITLVQSDLSIEDIEKGRITTCIGESTMINFKARALGIPAVTDFTFWPNANGNHYWSVIPFSKDSILYADGNFFFRTPGSYKLRNKIAKIYRYMYGAQEETSEIRFQEKDNKTFLLNPNLMDVTSQYFETTDVNMDLKTIEGKIFQNAYLCIFNNKKWSPIAFAKVNDNNNITFKNIGRECIFIIVYIEGNRLIPASNAFSINKDGKISMHVSDTSKKRNIRLKRKTKLKNRVINYGNRLRGSVFQLSNTSDFKNSIDVYRILDTDTIITPRMIDLNLNKTYRYARYRSPIGKNAPIAEMAWFSVDNKILGKIIGDDINNWKKYKKKVFDGNLLSYSFTSKINDGYGWIGQDFGKKQHISKLFFAPRSDVNYVNPGDTYELLYWNDKWVSLGTKKADAYYVDYEGVPENALFWLLNLSEGVEEELFIYKDKKQLFWNLTDL